MHADKIKTPLFVAQGAQDPRVNKNESDQMVEALKKRGVDVRIHGERQRRPRLPQRGKQVRFLRGDGKIPRRAFASGNGASFWSRRRFSLGEQPRSVLRLDRRKSIFRFAGIDPSRQFAVANAVEEINHEAKPKPDEEPNPRFNWQTQHERKTKEDAKNRKDWNHRNAEWSRAVWFFPTQDDHPTANEDEGEERSDVR